MNFLQALGHRLGWKTCMSVEDEENGDKVTANLAEEWGEGGITKFRECSVHRVQAATRTICERCFRAYNAEATPEPRRITKSSYPVS